MAKGDAGEDFLSGLFVDDDSDDNSDFELDAIIHGGYLEGDSMFGDLLIVRGDHRDVYRQSSLRDCNEPDQEENGTVGITRVPGAASTHSEAKNHALVALVN